MAIFLLGLVTFPWNQGASTFFVYTAAFLPFTFASVRRVLMLFGVEIAIIMGESAYFHTWPDPLHVSWPNMWIAVFLVLTVGGGNIFFAEQRRAECKLRAAQEENLALAAVAERERIARDLHDVLGHTLSLVVLKAELAGRLLESEENRDIARAAAEIADVERTARTALADVREAIGGYRARGLAAEIEAARRTLDAAGVELVAESCADAAAALTPQEETALALALREAVTNIVRHAHARRCVLRPGVKMARLSASETNQLAKLGSRLPLSCPRNSVLAHMLDTSGASITPPARILISALGRSSSANVLTRGAKLKAISTSSVSANV